MSESPASPGERCPCGCCDWPPHGPCPDFERGRNGRCVYCDHAESCHARERRPRGRPGKGA